LPATQYAGTGISIQPDTRKSIC